MPSKIELLNSALPEAVDHTDVESSGTMSAERCAPAAILEWPDFINEVRTHRRNLPIDNSRSDYSLPRFDYRWMNEFYDETAVQYALRCTASDAINQLFDDENVISYHCIMQPLYSSSQSESHPVR